MGHFRIIEHTADIGINVWGNSLKELFVNAAEGMVNFMTGRRSGGKGKTEKVVVTAEIREQLLVKWLEELIYLFEVRKSVPAAFRISNLSDKRLEAELETVSLDLKTIKYQIKAVTYHNLVIKEENGRFETTIIFDI